MTGIGNRALADVLGGTSGGWYFWRAALAALEVAIERSIEREQAFMSYPTGELRRFVRDVDDALALAELAAAVQNAIDGDDGDDGALAGTIGEALAARVREARARATNAA